MRPGDLGLCRHPGAPMWRTWDEAGPSGPVHEESCDPDTLVLVLELAAPDVASGVRVLTEDGRIGWLPSWRIIPV